MPRRVAGRPAAGSRVRVDGLTVLPTVGRKRYGSDTFFTVGTVPELRMGARVKVAKSNVGGTADPELYASYREGSFSYALPLPNGRWSVTLHMFEPDAEKAATRSFDVIANGSTALSGFNTAKAAGGALKAVTRIFPVEVRNGKLALQFNAARGDALVSAITIVPEARRAQ